MRRNFFAKFKSMFLPAKSLSLSIEPHDWKSAISEAEKIVGYSTSLLSLRCLLSDEISNVATQTKKLVGTSHPILKTAQKLFKDGKQSMQTRGLMVLLISKAAGPSTGNSLLETMVSGIYPSQRILAEITELIHTATLIHKSVVNLPHLEDKSKNGSKEDIEFGNKMAVLSGDYLLANASKNLASLSNTEVVEMISTAIRDQMKGEFSIMDGKERRFVEPEHVSETFSTEKWEDQTFLSSGSLLARGCQGALALAQHGPILQQAAFQFGKLMALAHQFKEDLTILRNPGPEIEDFNFGSMPVIIYLNMQQNPSKSLESLQNSTTKEISSIILRNQAVIKESKNLCLDYGKRAIESLAPFNTSDAKNVLTNMVKAVTNI